MSSTAPSEPTSVVLTCYEYGTSPCICFFSYHVEQSLSHSLIIHFCTATAPARSYGTRHSCAGLWYINFTTDNLQAIYTQEEYQSACSSRSIFFWQKKQAGKSCSRHYGIISMLTTGDATRYRTLYVLWRCSILSEHLQRFVIESITTVGNALSMIIGTYHAPCAKPGELQIYLIAQMHACFSPSHKPADRFLPSTVGYSFPHPLSASTLVISMTS